MKNKTAAVTPFHLETSRGLFALVRAGFPSKEWIIGGTFKHARTALTAAFLFSLFAAMALNAYAETPVLNGETLDIQKAIDTALLHQPNIIAAQKARVAAESRVGEARAGYLPQVNVSGVYQQTKSSVPFMYAFQSYNMTTSGSLVIYDFGRTSSTVAVQKYLADSAGFEVEYSKSNVVLGVKAAYYLLLQAKRNTSVGEETVAQLEQHLDLSRAFFNAGERPKYDVTKAEVDLSNAKIALIHAKSLEKSAKLNLDNALGVTGQYAVVDDLDYKKYEMALGDALKLADETRPDILSLKSRSEGVLKTVDLAKSGYWPTISANANYMNIQNYPDAWNYGFTLTIPIFSGFVVGYQIQEARANYEVLQANMDQLKLSITNEVQVAFVNLKEAEEKIPANELTVRLAKENLDIAEGRYSKGVGTPIEVTDAQITYSNAKTSYIASLLDYKVAQAALEKAIGGKL